MTVEIIFLIFLIGLLILILPAILSNLFSSKNDKDNNKLSISKNLSVKKTDNKATAKKKDIVKNIRIKSKIEKKVAQETKPVEKVKVEKVIDKEHKLNDYQQMLLDIDILVKDTAISYFNTNKGQKINIITITDDLFCHIENVNTLTNRYNKIITNRNKNYINRLLGHRIKEILAMEDDNVEKIDVKSTLINSYTKHYYSSRSIKLEDKNLQSMFKILNQHEILIK